jgi:hypothetical protein
MLERFLPQILDSNLYKKTAVVNARKLRRAELILTYTQGKNGIELETRRIGKPGDYVVKNPSGEEYIIAEKIFLNRYEHKLYSLYRPVGKVKAIKYNGPDINFYAGWGEKMILRTGDMLASPAPNYDEIYRIGIIEFLQSYSPDLL